MKLCRFGRSISLFIIFFLLMGFSPNNTAFENMNLIDSPVATQDKDDISIANMKSLMEIFQEDGEFSTPETYRALSTHMTAVGHYEERKSYKKAIKHMESFHILLHKHHENKRISDHAANILKEYADALIKKWEAVFDSERVMDHIRELSAGIGPRVAGTEEEKKAAEYLKKQFQSIGYDVSIQEFPINNRVERTLRILTDKNKELPVGAASGSATTDEHGITAELYYANHGLPGDFSDEAKGKIALVQRGENTFWEKVQNATNAQAAGVIIYDHEESLAPLRPTLNNNSTIPVVGVTKVDGESLREQFSKGSTQANLIIRTHTNQTSQNVVAVKKPVDVTNPEIVYVTAHYDSVPYSPGANDDGSGTAAVVEMARMMKDLATDKELRFIAFGAEEIGLVGSHYYVDHLPKEDLDRSAINFQMEMMGAKYEPASYLAFNTVDGEPNIAWDYTNAAFDKWGKDKEKLILFQRGLSDHVPFHNAGITAVCFNMGTANGGLEPEYHTPYDSIENISPERLQFAGDMISTAILDYVADRHPQQTYLKEAS